MVREFYTKKTEQIVKKIEMTQWEVAIQENLSKKHQYLSDN